MGTSKALLENTDVRPILAAGPLFPELQQMLAREYRVVQRADIAGKSSLGFEVLVTTSGIGADAALIRTLPNLRLIACHGAGLDRIDMAVAERNGILVCNTPTAVTQDTADYAIALIYALLRRVVSADRFVRGGRWEHERFAPSQRVSGRKLGILGLGAVGSLIAQKASALGMSVAYCATKKKDAPYQFLSNAQDLASASDVLIVCVPGQPSTDRIIDTEVLSCLGQDGFLINIARGSAVDESALLRSLRTHEIAGAALDVFDDEPFVDKAFYSIDNVILTPHHAAATVETRHAIASELLASIRAHFIRSDSLKSPGGVGKYVP